MSFLDIGAHLERALYPTVSFRPPLTVKRVQQTVAEHYELLPDMMISECRRREIAWPRQVAMYLARRLTNKSLPEIGRRFGGRDHSTVIHAIREVEKRMADDRAYARTVETLSAQLSPEFPQVNAVNVELEAA